MLKENERIDKVPGTDYEIIQNSNKFSYGTDAIFLSEFARGKGKIVELGTGTGIIPIRVMGRKNPEKIYAIEIQEEMANMAKRSVKLNKLEEKIQVLNLDFREIESKFPKASIDEVISNPPYIKKGSGIKNKSDTFTISRHEVHGDIEDLIKAAEYLLKPKGRLFLVHRPDRLVDIFYYMRKYKIEPKTIKFVRPSKDKVPNLVLIEGIKFAKAELRILEDLIVYSNGEYTEEIGEIYYG